MKFLIGLLTAILISSVTYAQHGSSPAGHVNLGIKGGLNVYNIHLDDNTNLDRRIGYHFGLLGHIHFNSHYAFQPEIVYSTQGARTNVANATTETNLDYVNIPVLFQYMFDGGFRIQAGPQIGFLVSAKSKTDGTSTDIKDDLKPFDFAVSVGLSYVVPATGFGIDARYNIGLSKLNKDAGANSTNRGFQFGLFYIFGH